MTSPYITIERNTAITMWILVGEIGMGNIFVPIHQNIRVSIPPHEGSKLNREKCDIDIVRMAIVVTLDQNLYVPLLER